MTDKNAFFRYEASFDRGAGHAMRCSAVADALSDKGWTSSFITSLDTYEFIPALSRFARIDPHKFYEAPLECDLLVVDHYDLDSSYESRFRPYAKKIMVIDDLADRLHDCDVLLDQTYGRNPEDYRSLVPEACEILAGSEYILLRPEFAKLRPQALEKRKATTEIKKILVNMGGSDAKNFTLKALKLIKESKFKGDIDVVLGFSAPHIEVVKAFVKTMPNQVVFHMNANMAQLIYEADLAIGAGGTSVWERCCLGLPSIVMILADNQNFIYHQLKRNNLMSVSINSYIEDPLLYHSISEKLGVICDGMGSSRVIERINSGLVT